MQQFVYEPCLFRYVLQDGEECFLLQYVDDSLIAGTKKAIESLKEKLKGKFKCKFQQPRDFLGMDIEHMKLGDKIVNAYLHNKNDQRSGYFTR